MRIDPELASTLAATVDAGSLEGAAGALGVTPSAVSQRLKALEQQLGRVLLVRSRPVQPTEAGEAVVRMARQISLLERDAIAALGVREGDAQTSVPLAVNADSMATWFLAPLTRLAETHDIVFDLHRDDQDFTARLLESGEVMAAVTSQATPVTGCSVTPLGALVYEAMASADYARRWFSEGVTAEALGSAPFVDFDRRDLLQHRWLAQRGVDAGSVPRHHVPASNDFADAVRSGLGWGMLPRLQISDGAVATGALVPLGGEAIAVPLYWQQWNLRSALLQAITAEVVAEARRVLG